MRMVVFFIFATLVWFGGHAFIADRLIRKARVQGRARIAALVLIGLAIVLPVAQMALMRNASGAEWARPVALAAFAAMGVSSVVFVMLMVGELVVLGRRAVRIFRPVADKPDPSRRGFLRRALNVGALGTAGTVGVVGYAQASTVPGVVEVEVPITGLPPELEGLTIVQLTDMHVGPTIHREQVQAMVDRANELDGDIVAITGDLVDGSVEMLRRHVEPIGQLRSRHGAYFCTGNHEYYSGAVQWCEEVERLGLTVLNNEHRVLEVDGAKLLLAGVTDHRGGEYVPSHVSDPAGARRGAPECDASILLAHQPRSIDDAADAGYDLQISGHTHGGQYFPMNLLVYFAQPYVAGLHRHRDTWIYVSRGSAYWGPPIRFGAPHEITKITLRAR